MRWLIGSMVTVMVLAADTASADVVRVVDDFNDGVLAPEWKVMFQDGGGTYAESGGTLNVGGFAGQKGELVLRYNVPIADTGSVRVDYQWTGYTGHKARVGLGFFDSLVSFQTDERPHNGIWLKGVRYQSIGRHAVDGRLEGGPYNIDYNVPTSGAFKIERNGSEYKTSYLDNGSWQTFFTATHDFGDTPLYPYLFTSNSNTMPQWGVALDNFEADVVPEPSALMLMGVALLGGLLLRKRFSSVKPT